MKELMVIVEDLLLTFPPDFLAGCINILDPEDSEGIKDAILRTLNQKKIQTLSDLSHWIEAMFGLMGVTLLLKKIGITFDKSCSVQELIAQWFEYRDLEVFKPKVRPVELTQNTRELATQINISPENFDAVALLCPRIELLMRYIVYFYVSELSRHTDVVPLLGARDDYAETLQQLGFEQLCYLLTCDKQLKSQPYNSGCNDYVTLSNDKAKTLLAQLPSLVSAYDHDTQAENSKKLSNCVLELLEHWNPHQGHTIVPKGAVVSELSISRLSSRVICRDEFNNSLTLNGVTTAMATRNNLLLAQGETSEEEIWAFKLQPLPDHETWTTPAPTSSFQPNFPHHLAVSEKVEASVRDKVFVSYSHKDKPWLDELLIQLKPYKLNGSISAWSDKQIVPGSKWFVQIQAALDQTKVAVMLVSPNFLASDFIYEHELGPLLKVAEQGGVHILWIPVRASSYEKTPLKDYQAVGEPDKPLARMNRNQRDEAWVEICKEIEKAVNSR
jgi:hypothetical protein